jgi:hypothetical protein
MQQTEVQYHHWWADGQSKAPECSLLLFMPQQHDSVCLFGLFRVRKLPEGARPLNPSQMMQV